MLSISYQKVAVLDDARIEKHASNVSQNARQLRFERLHAYFGHGVTVGVSREAGDRSWGILANK
jgi:hypothetical protein